MFSSPFVFDEELSQLHTLVSSQRNARLSQKYMQAKPQSDSHLGAHVRQNPCKMPDPQGYVRKRKTAALTATKKANKSASEIRVGLQYSTCRFAREKPDDAPAFRDNDAYGVLLSFLVCTQTTDAVELCDGCVIGTLNAIEK